MFGSQLRTFFFNKAGKGKMNVIKRIYCLYLFFVALYILAFRSLPYNNRELKWGYYLRPLAKNDLCVEENTILLRNEYESN